MRTWVEEVVVTATGGRWRESPPVGSAWPAMKRIYRRLTSAPRAPCPIERSIGTEKLCEIGRERLDVTDAWIGAVRRRDRATAGYATFANVRTTMAMVVALECPVFERVEMHEPADCGDSVTMREITSLSILAGDSVNFSPGGRHLLFIGPRRTLGNGQIVGITATFSSGRKRVLPFRVMASMRAL